MTLALTKELPVQLDEQANATAIDEPNVAHFEQTVLAERILPNLRALIDLGSAENFRHAQALPGRFADNG